MPFETTPNTSLPTDQAPAGSQGARQPDAEVALNQDMSPHAGENR